MGKIISSLGNTKFLVVALAVALLFAGTGKIDKFTILKQVGPEVLENNVQTDPKLFADPLSADYFSAKNISEIKPTSVLINFKHPMKVGGFSVFFPGNMETDASYVPADFDVYIKQVESDWMIVDRKRDFGKSSYILKLNEKFNLEGIKIMLLRSEHKNSEVRISDLKIYTKSNVNLKQYLSWIVFTNSKSFWSYLALSVLFYFGIMVPGSGLLMFFFTSLKKTIDPGTISVFGPLLSMFVLAISALVFIISGEPIFLYSYLPYLLIGSVLFSWKKAFMGLTKNKFLLFIPFVFILATSLLQVTRDTLLNLNYIEFYLDKLNPLPLSSYFGYHADNTMPWGIARSFLNKVGPYSQEALNYRLGQPASSVTNRIPTLSLIVTPILKLLGESHFIFQRFINVLVSLYYLAVYWTIKQYFSDRISRLTTLMVLLSVPLSLIAWNAELNIKYISMYPLILATGLVAKNKHPVTWLVGLLLTLAVLVHPMAILFVPAIVIVIWLARKPFAEKIIDSIKSCLPPIIVLGSWFLITPLVNRGAATSLNPSTASNIYTYFNADSLTWFTKASNIINIFVPDYLNRFYPNFLTGEYGRLFFRVSIIGSISPLFVYYLFFRTRIATYIKYFSVIVLSMIPQIIFWLHPHYYDFSSFALFFPFCVPFLIGLVTQDLTKNESKRRRNHYFISYIIFMGLGLFITSNAFPDLKYWDNTIWVYSVALWGVFVLISTYFVIFQKKTS